MLGAIGIPFVPDAFQLGPFAAELALIATIVAVLLSPFFSTRRSNGIAAAVALAGLAIALLALVAAWPVNAGFRFGAAGASPDVPAMLLSDGLAVMWKALLLLFAMGIVVMWFATSGTAMHAGDGPEFFTLILGATLGMCLMGSSTNLLMIFMAMELASLPSYVLAGFRKTSRLGSEASLKYVLFGAAASSIMVYGMSMLYGQYGTLQIEAIATSLPHSIGPATVIGVAGLLVGIGFKISLVPLHFWCPDVFEGAGIDVAAFLSVASKGAALVLLLRIVMNFADGLAFSPQSDFIVVLAVALGAAGAITATVGNTAAFVQNNIKRLLAYSSIAHAGYMVCVLSLLVGADRSAEASQAILLYLAVYLFMNLGAFTVAGLIHRATGSENINDYAGLGRRNPLLAVTMAAFMFSLVGLPPLGGFVAKFWIMYILGDAGGWWWALVAVIGLNTVFSLYFYMRVVRVMFLVSDDRPPISVHPLGSALSTVCAVVLLAMLIGFSPLLSVTKRQMRLGTRPATAAAPAAPADVTMTAQAGRMP